MIGEAQRFQWIDAGKPGSKPSVTNALPALKASFQDPNSGIRWSAAQVIEGLGFLGSNAAPFAAEIREMAEGPKNDRYAKKVLRQIQP